MGRATVRPDVCSKPTTGATVRLVCTLSSPLPGAGLLSGVTPVWATCTLPGLWCCLDGIWHISRGGSARCTRAGGAGSALFAALPSGDPLQEGTCSTRREADTLEGWIYRSTALGVCEVQASLVNSFPLGLWLGDGRGRWCLTVPLFPAKLSSVIQGSKTLPPFVL